MGTVAIFVAHPDDEVLGCGGTIAWHIAKGDKVYVIILAEGISSREDSRKEGNSSKQLNQLIKSARKAHDILGTNSIKFLNFPDNRMDSLDLLNIIKIVEKELEQIAPDTVYTHHVSDLNIDHQITNKAVITACRPYPNQAVKKIITFEVQSSTDWQQPNSNNNFAPNYYIDVSGYLTKKLKALEAYSLEMRPWPHSRSNKALKHLACWRGSTVGFKAAEAFQLIRELKK